MECSFQDVDICGYTDTSGISLVWNRIQVEGLPKTVNIFMGRMSKKKLHTLLHSGILIADISFAHTENSEDTGNFTYTESFPDTRVFALAASTSISDSAVRSSVRSSVRSTVRLLSPSFSLSTPSCLELRLPYYSQDMQLNISLTDNSGNTIRRIDHVVSDGRICFLAHGSDHRFLLELVSGTVCITSISITSEDSCTYTNVTQNSQNGM